MTEKTVSYIDLEPHLRDAVRLGDAIRTMHIESINDPVFDTEVQYLVMEALIDRLRADTKEALEIWEATFHTAPDTVV